jgi:hypothetical protein
MPNHVSTILKLSGDSKQIKKFIADIKVKGKEEYDFDLLLPVPVELQNTTSPTRIVSEAEYQQAVAKAEAAKEAFKRGEIRQIELEFSLQLPITQAMSDDFKNRFGFDNWYEWRLKIYGTKWGMYNVEFDGVDGFSYDTAWSPASEYFLTVSKKYPKVNFTHEFADEGGGFVGFETICNGQTILAEDFDWHSRKGIAARERLGYYSPENEEEEAE